MDQAFRRRQSFNINDAIMHKRDQRSWVAATAFLLAWETKGLLIGEAADQPIVSITVALSADF